MTPKVRPQHPRRYSITPLPTLTAEQLATLDRSKMDECFRIEFLLRSEHLQDLFRRDRKRTGNALRERYKILDGWDILKGSHHTLLEPRVQRHFLADGILDLTAMARDMVALDATIRDSKSGILYVGLDPRYLPGKLWKALKPRLIARAAALPQVRSPFRFIPSQTYSTWKQYLHCYDLSRDGRKPADIGSMVYGARGTPSQRRDQVKKAVKRVKAAIATVGAVK